MPINFHQVNAAICSNDEATSLNVKLSWHAPSSRNASGAFYCVQPPLMMCSSFGGASREYSAAHVARAVINMHAVMAR